MLVSGSKKKGITQKKMKMVKWDENDKDISKNLLVDNMIEIYN